MMRFSAQEVRPQEKQRNPTKMKQEINSNKAKTLTAILYTIVLSQNTNSNT